MWKSVDQQKCAIESWYQRQPSNSYFYASFTLNQISYFDFEYSLLLSAWYRSIWTRCAELTLYLPKRGWNWRGGCIFHPSTPKRRACTCTSELVEGKIGTGEKHWIIECVHKYGGGGGENSKGNTGGEEVFVRVKVRNLFLHTKAASNR